MKYSVIGSGQYNWDRIVLRNYPNGFTPGKRNICWEEVLVEEVGGTCGNVSQARRHPGNSRARAEASVSLSHTLDNE